MIRFDMRNENELRPLTFELNLISEASGSCKLNSGDTSAISKVYGPNTPKFLRHEDIEKGTVEVELSLAGYSKEVVDIKPNANSDLNSNSALLLNTKLEKSMIKYIKHVLESVIILTKFPKLVIIIQITLLNDDGASLPLCLNAAVLALLDASIPLYGVPLSLQISQINLQINTNVNHEKQYTNTFIIVDPTKDEENKAISNFIFTYIYKNVGTVEKETSKYCLLASDCRGKYSLDDLNNINCKAIESIEILQKSFLEIMKTK